MFFKMNMGIVLLDFSLIFKIFCKSLVNKKNSRLKTKRSHFWPVPPEIYFQDWKSSECKLILKMVPQSIYWKQCLCQHLPAFLGDRGGSGWAVVPLSTAVQVQKQEYGRAAGREVPTVPELEKRVQKPSRVKIALGEATNYSALILSLGWETCLRGEKEFIN